MVVQKLVAIWVLLQEEMSTHPSTLPSFTKCSVVLYSIRLYTHHQIHPQLGVVSEAYGSASSFLLWPNLFILSEDNFLLVLSIVLGIY